MAKFLVYYTHQHIGSQDVSDTPDNSAGKAHTVRAWAVGVTTAPRKEPTLKQTLESLSQAGWEAPRLFIEPGTEIPDEFQHLPRTQRDERLGAFPSWYLALSELVMRYPKADAYLLCQDDVIFSQGLRPYLERELWPAPRVGVVSLYCPSHYGPGLVAENENQGFYKEDRGWQSWGALAYVFPNDAARAILSDARVIGHRFEGPANGLRNIDSVVGRWCRDSHRPYYVHVPSLAQHTGTTSTIWSQARNARRRRADRFVERIQLESTEKQSPELRAEQLNSPAVSQSKGDFAQPSSVITEAPALADQMWRFVTALTRHAADGMQKSSQEEVTHRLSICQRCPSFKDNRCRECGCRCNEQKVFLNKLAWRSESCPLGRW